VNGISFGISIVILGLAVTGIISAVILKLQRLKIEEARLAAGSAGDEELAHQVAVLQNEMAELQERVDFSERMLAQLKDLPALPRASDQPAE
jgi:Tfp pilus assembly protein PilO